MNVAAILEQAQLQQYTGALSELGCVDINDLTEFEYDDLVGVGMTTIEIKRLLRNLG